MTTTESGHPALALLTSVLLWCAAVLVPPFLTATALEGLTGDITGGVGLLFLVGLVIAVTVGLLGLGGLILQRPRRRRRPRARVASTVALVAYTVFCAVAYLALFNSSMRRDLVATDFQTSSAPFPEGPQPGFDAGAVDGRYEMVQTASNSGTFVSTSSFVGTADMVDASVDVSAPDSGPDTPRAFGIGCLDGPESGVIMLVTSDGTDVRLVDWYSNAEFARLSKELMTPPANYALAGSPETAQITRPAEPVRTLRITCKRQVDWGSSVTTSIRGYVNGAQVVTGGSVSNEVHGIALAFTGDREGTTARFDNVHARHP